MKLQKLVYYSQAWATVWDEKPIFNERIEAWAAGPVIPALYEFHRGQFAVKDWPRGDPDSLPQEFKDTIDGVINFYGGKNAQQLSDLTHREAPWKNARSGMADGERGNVEITPAALHEYYSSISA